MLIFIHSLSSGGAERVAANLANHWVGRGRQVTVVTLASRQLDFYELHPSVQRIALDLASASTSTFTAAVNNLKRVAALRRILCEIRPHIVVGMMSETNVLLCLAAVGLPGMKVIVSEHIYPPMMPLGRLWERLRRLTYPLADVVTMLTSEGLAWLRREIPRAHGVKMPNPIAYPLPAFEPRLMPTDWVVPDRKLLLAAGRLCEQKGFDQLLQAFVVVSAANPKWDLIILGEGALRSELERQVQVLGLAGRVFLPGRAGNIGDWYSRADLYVMSSRFEGFGLTLGEAMAFGCPAVSFDCDAGPRDIIRHEVDGLLVPASDVVSLGSALWRLMCDEDLRRRMARRAIEVRERFSIERIGEMWEVLFEELRHE